MADNEQEEADFWDLDHTGLNTERKLFRRIKADFADFTGESLTRVQRTFDEVNAQTFSWDNWFLAFGIDAETRMFLRGRYEAMVTTRIESCVYPGVIDLMRRRKASGIRQVLVTAGDPAWQKWKFEQIVGMHEVFAESDRHFVTLDGSKAQRIASYSRSMRRANFVDDSARWLREAGAWGIPGLRRIRPQWPDTHGTKPEPEDGVDWTVTTTIEELTAALEAE